MACPTAALFLTLVCLPLSMAANEVTIFAAASLTGALDHAAAQWTRQTGQEVVLSYGGSSALARQIQQGAPADIFIAASGEWMDALQASGDIDPASRRDVAGNSLVLVANGPAAPVTIDRDLDLPAMLDGGRLSMAMVDSVPAGQYGKAALMHLGLWNGVLPFVAQSDNVRTALTFVAQGEAPLGIVYATDAAAEDGVSVIGTFPTDSHDPITYPAAITAQSDSDQARVFLDYLSSDAARAIWADAGFTIPE